MKVKVKGYEGILVLLERQWTHEYTDMCTRYTVKLQVDRDTIIDILNVKCEDIKFVEE